MFFFIFLKEMQVRPGKEDEATWKQRKRKNRSNLVRGAKARRQQLAVKQLQRKASGTDVKPVVAKIAPVLLQVPTPSTSSISLFPRPSSKRVSFKFPRTRPRKRMTGT